VKSEHEGPGPLRANGPRERSGDRSPEARYWGKQASSMDWKAQPESVVAQTMAR